MPKKTDKDTIFAIATPPGVGGIGIIRLSGPDALSLAKTLTDTDLTPRLAKFCSFRDASGQTLDSGLALYFPQPASFTGEDVVEIQGHGGPVVQQMLSNRLLELGARAAHAGEFSERAFLNDKIDLSQAEAIADLISSGTEAAARAAHRSLDGVFAERIQSLQEQLTQLRVFVEAALDFPDEEIDFIAESDVVDQLDHATQSCLQLLRDAHRGQILRDGINTVILGVPNAGKSSLLNALAGRDSAIVTDVAGTTRDVLRESIAVDGLPLHIADTAGLREADNAVEIEGVKRARQAAQTADLILLVIDLTQDTQQQQALRSEIPDGITVIEIHNKIDLTGKAPFVDEQRGIIGVSVSHNEGLSGLTRLIHQYADLQQGEGGGVFSARTRHLDALSRAKDHIKAGRARLTQFNCPETLAEELRLAQQDLSEITGQYLPDDLLGAIFSSFCIGK